MKQICEGLKSKGDMIDENKTRYKDIFIRTRQEFAKITDVSGTFIYGRSLTV